MMSDTSIFIGKRVNLTLILGDNLKLRFTDAFVLGMSNTFITIKDAKDGAVRQFSRNSIIAIEVQK